MFVKDKLGNYTNADFIQGAWAEQDGTNWVIKVSVSGAPANTQLSGTWASQSECQEAIRELFDGVDPATYGD